MRRPKHIDIVSQFCRLMNGQAGMDQFGQALVVIVHLLKECPAWKEEIRTLRRRPERDGRGYRKG